LAAYGLRIEAYRSPKLKRSGKRLSIRNHVADWIAPTRLSVVAMGNVSQTMYANVAILMMDPYVHSIMNVMALSGMTPRFVMAMVHVLAMIVAHVKMDIFMETIVDILHASVTQHFFHLAAQVTVIV
jgi:hypothetical protein